MFPLLLLKLLKYRRGIAAFIVFTLVLLIIILPVYFIKQSSTIVLFMMLAVDALLAYASYKYDIIGKCIAVVTPKGRELLQTIV